jgi:small subunit ribosomal protein S21
MTQINLRKGEPVEKALRRLKKIMIREGVFQEVRDHRYYEKPSAKSRKKMKAARFTAMLRERYADL